MWKKFYTNSGIIMLAVLAAGVWTSNGLSASQAESVISQFVPSEKEWQFHNLSGIPIWVVKNEVVSRNPTSQEIYILLESKYFKKEILTKVFAEMSRKTTDVDWVTISAYSDKKVLRRMIIIDELDAACIDWRKLPDKAKEALGLPIKSSVKGKGTFYARYFAFYSKNSFYYTPVAGPETVEEVVLSKDND
jgi:hypothetical protein